MNGRWFSTVHSAWELVTDIFILVLHILPWFWELVAKAPWVPRWGKYDDIIETVIFVLISSGVHTLMGMPWDIYQTFVLEQRHGFNKRTPLLFITDLLLQVGRGFLGLLSMAGR